MSAFPKIRKGLPRRKCLLLGHRLNRYSNFSQSGVQLPHAAVATSRFCDDRGLNKRNRRYPAISQFEQKFSELVGFLLAKQDGENRGGIHNHLGSPFSSYRNVP